MNPNDRVIARRNPGATGFGESTFGNSTFGNSTMGGLNSGASDFGNSAYGPSGIVPTAAQGMPQNIVGLLQAMHVNTSLDTVKLTMGVAQWQILAGYLQSFTMEAGQALIDQGAKDTTVYIVESGTLSVHFADDAGNLQIATVGAGSCAGEGAFFSRMPRPATVQAASRCKLWAISPMRFIELSNRHPAVALPLVMALASVLSRRSANKPRRGAVT